MNENAKHTPGTWKWDAGVIPPDGPGRYADIYVIGEDGEPLIIAEFNDSIPEGRANARLIASAPTLAAENERLKALVAEMVEGLKPFADEAEDWTYEATGEIYADATPIDAENRLRVGHMRQAYALVARAKAAS